MADLFASDEFGSGAGKNDDTIAGVGGDVAECRTAFAMRAGTPYYRASVAVQADFKDALAALHFEVFVLVAILFKFSHDSSFLL
jgi:hypothetical protein